MRTDPAGLVLQHIRKMVKHTGAPPPDTDLLQRFVRQRDEEAFAALVKRHGPVVLGVCRRVLHQAQDAEDVFQATFLVLARKAGSIRRRESVGSWLHGIAYRLACKARADAARRRRLEPRAGEMTTYDPLATLTGRELGQALDEELHRLPERYRAPLVLCCLQGWTQDEAARELGWSKGTLRRRLTRGRVLLMARLSGRGLMPASLTAPPVPAALVDGAVRAALAPGAASGAVSALAEAGVQALAPIKVRAGLVGLLATGVLALATAVVAYQTAPQAPTSVPESQDPPQPGEPAPQWDEPLPEGAVARLGTRRGRSWAPMLALAFTPDSRTIVTTGIDAPVRLWDAETGRPLRQFSAEHIVGMRGLSLAADGRTLATVTDWHRPAEANLHVEDWTVEWWDLTTGKRTRSLGGGRFLGQAALAPDGKKLAYLEFNREFDRTQEDGRVWLRDLTGKHPPLVLDSASFTRFADRWTLSEWFVQFSADGRRLAVGGRFDLSRLQAGTVKHLGGLRSIRPPRPLEGYPVQVWDVPTGRRLCVLSGDEGRGTCLAFTPDGQGLATGGADGTVRLWDLATGKCRRTLRVPEGEVVCLAPGPDGKTLVAGSRTEKPLLVAWDLASGREVYRQPLAARAVAPSPDGRRLAVVDEDNVLRVLDARTGRPLLAPPGHTLPVRVLVYSADGRELASADEAGRVYRWDPVTGRVKAEYAAGADPRWLAFAPDGALLTADRGTPGGLRVRDLATGTVRRRLDVEAGSGGFQLSPDGSVAMTYERLDEQGGSSPWARGRLWEVAAGKPWPSGKLGSASWGPVVFSADGKRLVTVDGNLVVWDLPTGRRVAAFERLVDPSQQESLAGCMAPAGAGFSPDGRLLATCEGFGPIRLCDLATGTERRLANPGGAGNPWAMAISPDRRLLATGGADGIVRLWDVAGRKELRRFTGHEGALEALAFAPDGRTLASGSADTTILIWNTACGPREGRR
jgi:RNA polymerase sigma factor (sigma-70 family)